MYAGRSIAAPLHYEDESVDQELFWQKCSIPWHVLINIEIDEDGGLVTVLVKLQLISAGYLDREAKFHIIFRMVIESSA